MRSVRLPILRACRGALLPLILLLTGCGTDVPARTSPSMKPSSDLNQLGSLIHLPAAPLHATFEKVTRGHGGGLGPTDWELIALLEYDPQTLAALTAPSADASADGQTAQTAALFSDDEVRPWFPPEVKAAIRPDGTGINRCRGPGFDAAPFAKSPLLQGGFVVPEGTHLVVLRMYTS